ncbi:HNH endonuclease signature motif containing protein [Nocardioides psychrotolerans]|uniref:HNH endonuclease signature motif containing protein n=1 Tax=Nocardioides psychrotolerans TaxID=1005945 RepID=UPI0031382543
MTTVIDPHQVDDDAPTPTDLITLVRQTRAAADQAALDLFHLAIAWAHAHPETPGDQSWKTPRRAHVPAGELGDRDDRTPRTGDLDEDQWFGIPPIAWNAAAPFATANNMSTTAGRAFIRDSLVIRHRMPRLHAKVSSGKVPVWRAHRIARAVLGTPRDVIEHVDQAIAPIADTAGLVTVDRLIDEARLEMYAELVEIESLEALEHRHVTLDERTMGHTGIATMDIRADWADLHDFDTALSQVAEALKRDGSLETLDVRRSMAVGILADPARALALLNHQDAPAPSKSIVAYVHLNQDALEGRGLLATDEHGHTLLATTVRDWLARQDRHVTIRPVLDLRDHCAGGHNAGHDGSDPYVPAHLIAEKVRLRNPTCVFPHCSKPSRSCDLDHLIAHATSGVTCECNLAPLCRHHHQLKTHAGWRYQQLTPGTFLWREPHGQTLLTTPQGTRDLTDP